MVVQGAFKVEMVEAKSKIPLKEHFKNGRTYVEVEPGTQFLLRIQKVARHEKRLAMNYHCEPQQQQQQHEQPDYFGLYERKHGGKEVSTRALECIRPKLDPEKTGVRMGIVEVLVYESTYVGERTTTLPIAQNRPPPSSTKRDRHNSQSPRFEEQTVSCHEARSLGMKCVRAKPGTVELKDQVSSKQHRSGRLLEVIAIQYCSLPGLMHAGILPVPNNFHASHRTIQLVKKRSIARASSSTVTASVPPKKRRVCVSKIVEVDSQVVSKHVVLSNSDLYDFIPNLPAKMMVNE